MKVEDPRGLNPKFEGPYKVISRPSRTQVTVRVGSFADGQPRLLTYNWSSCKPAKLREGAAEASRPNVGRRPNPPKVQNKLNVNKTSTGADVATATDNNHETSTDVEPQQAFIPAERGKFKSNTTDADPDFEPPLGRVVHPDYYVKGPVISKAMYDKWTPDMLGIPPSSARPVRSTRNPAPKYVDAVGFFGFVAR